MRAVLFRGTGDLIPLYAIYALLFADHGLNTAQISSLLVIWSATAFLLEVPSGAWADTVSRRDLLVLSGALLTAGFALWTWTPGYLGFALGFVLWGASGALVSGTFQALLYDELSLRGDLAADPGAYARILGYTRAASETAILVGILAATPLYLWGGYPLIGWTSVLVALLHTCVALTLPSAPRAVSATAVDDLEDEAAEEVSTPNSPTGSLERAVGSAVVAASSMSGPFARYLTMLRTGVREAVRVRVVRYGVLLEALLMGITAFDEYFALLAEDVGVPTVIVPLLMGLTVLGSLAGSMLAGRTERMSGRTMALAVGAGGVLFTGGAIVTGLATRQPEAVYVLAGVGFTAIGTSYGIVYNTAVVAGARLQDAIQGPARATVTSVSGLAAELVALAVFGFVALATVYFTMATTVAILGATMLLIALLAPRWLPRRTVDFADAH